MTKSKILENVNKKSLKKERKNIRIKKKGKNSTLKMLTS